jgi:hypothetical protein
VLLVGCKSDLRPAGGGGGPSSGVGSSTAAGPVEGNGHAAGGEEEETTTGSYVTTLQGQRVASQIGAREYKECSALKTEGVDDVFEAATRASMLIRDHHGRVRGGGGGKSKGSKGKGKGSGEGGGRRGEDGGGCCVVV